MGRIFNRALEVGGRVEEDRFCLGQGLLQSLDDVTHPRLTWGAQS